MNLQYRSVEELTLNLYSRCDRMLFYQEHYYDNVYFVSDTYMFQGFRNLELESQDQECENVQDSISVTSGLCMVREWFKENPGKFRLPVLDNGMLVGEYFDADAKEVCLYRRIEDKALSIAEVFKDEIISWIDKRKVTAVCRDDELDELRKLFPMISVGETDSECDITLDLVFAPHFRKMLSSDSPTTISLSEILIPILARIAKTYYEHHGIGFIAIAGPLRGDLNGTDASPYLFKSANLEKVLHDDSYVNEFCAGDQDSRDYLSAHRDDLNNLSRFMSNGIHNVLIDKCVNGFTVVDGKRVTSANPPVVMHSINMFGPCVVEGLCVPDDKTIPSMLQAFVNRVYGNVAVVNHGLAYGKDLLNDLLYMMATPMREGDMVLWMSGFNSQDCEMLSSIGIPLLDVKDSVHSLSSWCLDSPFHCNSVANEVMAKTIYDGIEWNFQPHTSCSGLSTVIEGCNIRMSFDPDAILDSREMSDYLRLVERHRNDDSNLTKGCIVMNANPCTNGHIYLINEALKQVDILYVFLVEGSTGGFEYLDRLHMLEENFIGNDNVVILSGGSILTSEICFPDYFNTDRSVCKTSPLLNHKVFALRIAPRLGISKRFFGEEPYDMVTKALNDSAELFLPSNGVEVIILDRLRYGDQVVSAKTVRRLFSENRFELIAPLVPFSTFRQLSNMVGQTDEGIIREYFDSHR